nr:hypothetical protein Iba_chr10aCG15300 [Ipomoea batatas]
MIGCLLWRCPHFGWYDVLPIGRRWIVSFDSVRLGRFAGGPKSSVVCRRDMISELVIGKVLSDRFSPGRLQSMTRGYKTAALYQHSTVIDLAASECLVIFSAAWINNLHLRNHFQNVRNFCVFSVNFQGASERFARWRCSTLAVAESIAWAIFQTVGSAIGGSASSDKDFGRRRQLLVVNSGANFLGSEI